jgi:hypothetical protein
MQSAGVVSEDAATEEDRARLRAKERAMNQRSPRERAAGLCWSRKSVTYVLSTLYTPCPGTCKGRKILYPIDAHGVFKLDSEAYKALLIMKEHGDPQLPTEQGAFNQNRLSPRSVNDAINAWRSINNAMGPTPP